MRETMIREQWNRLYSMFGLVVIIDKVTIRLE